MSDSFLEETSEDSIGERKRSRSPVYLKGSSKASSCSPKTCDDCIEPQEPDESPRLIGGLFTYVNADKDPYLRHLAELALILYNDEKLEDFRLLKVCKANFGGAGYNWLTFRAHEDGTDECLLFRGVVCVVGGEKALFCGIKEDDEVTLSIDDDDYVGPKTNA